MGLHACERYAECTDEGLHGSVTYMNVRFGLLVDSQTQNPRCVSSDRQFLRIGSTCGALRALRLGRRLVLCCAGKLVLSDLNLEIRIKTISFASPRVLRSRRQSVLWRQRAVLAVRPDVLVATPARVVACLSDGMLPPSCFSGCELLSLGLE